jgi:hypothetical protein
VVSTVLENLVIINVFATEENPMNPLYKPTPIPSNAISVCQDNGIYIIYGTMIIMGIILLGLIWGIYIQKNHKSM